LIQATQWPNLLVPPGAMGWVLPHFQDISGLQLALFMALGLVMGSFLNVLIHRLPLMILSAHHDEAPPLNLSTPRSHCPHCLHPLAWYELLPVVSFAMARGRCRHCGQHISWRYPFVEIATAALFALCLWQFGFTGQALMACFFVATLLALTWIDAETFLLPDVLTQALLWVGLVSSAMSLTPTPLIQSVSGAVMGYGLLWGVGKAFQIWTGKEGMGQGDLKLLAGLGAWVGIWSLLPVLLLASVSGLIFGVIQKMRGQLGDNGHFAFGPFLALSGFACFFLGISMGV
jgi:leader peptidase (prepilin peptidase)/N-methyltransferase